MKVNRTYEITRGAMPKMTHPCIDMMASYVESMKLLNKPVKRIVVSDDEYAKLHRAAEKLVHVPVGDELGLIVLTFGYVPVVSNSVAIGVNA